MKNEDLLHLLSYQDTAAGTMMLHALSLDQFLPALNGVSQLDPLSLAGLLETVSLTQADIQIILRQISQELDVRVDDEGNGQVLIGKQVHEKRFTFFFEQGHSTGLRKITVPYHSDLLNLQTSHSAACLPSKVHALFINLKSNQYPLLTAPLAIVTLGGYLKRIFGSQVGIDYYDLQLESPGTTLQYIARSSPDILGISVKIGELEEMYQLLDGLRTAQLPRRPLIVLGNVIPTYAADEIYRAYPEVVCVIGRGETAMQALVEQIATRPVQRQFFQIPNSSFVLGSTIYQVDGIPFHLAELGAPDWNTLFQRYHPSRYQEVWLESSRGCPQKKSGVGCSFCAIMPNNDSRDWVSRPTEAVLEEIRSLSYYGIKHIRFADEEFMAGQTTQALELSHAFKRLREDLQCAGLTMPTFDFAIRVDDVYRRGQRQLLPHVKNGQGMALSNNDIRRLALITFKEAGLTQVYLGLESGSFQQLKRMYKAVIPEDNQRAVQILRELGIQVAGGWIMIDPLMEEIAELRENITFLEDNRLIPLEPGDDFVTNPINRMRVLEGSPFVQLMRKHRLLGRRKENLIEYEFRYKDPRIAAIAHMLDTWEEEIGPWMYALKNKVAMGVLDQEAGGKLEYLGNYLFDLKDLDFQLIQAIVSSIDQASSDTVSSDLATIMIEFKKKRKVIILRLASDIVQGIVEDNARTLRTGLEQIGISL